MSALRLFNRADRCSVLGPGFRTVLWVQGCPFRCPGCVVPESQATSGGTLVDVDQLAEEICALPEDIEGVTFSGGEPMSQAEPLSELINSIRTRREMSFMSYSGYTLPYLRQWGSSAQRLLLDRLDILVDGPFLQARLSRRRWRGSDNQRVHFLSARYRHLEHVADDEGTWIEVTMDAAGHLFWMGIPPYGFREKFELALGAVGASFKPEGGTL